MGILFGIKFWYSKSSKSMVVSTARSWLLKKVYISQQKSRISFQIKIYQENF